MTIDKLILVILVLWFVHDFAYIPLKEWHDKRRKQ
jgi:hypothetical protein